MSHFLRSIRLPRNHWSVTGALSQIKQSRSRSCPLVAISCTQKPRVTPIPRGVKELVPSSWERHQPALGRSRSKSSPRNQEGTREPQPGKITFKEPTFQGEDKLRSFRSDRKCQALCSVSPEIPTAARYKRLTGKLVHGKEVKLKGLWAPKIRHPALRSCSHPRHPIYHSPTTIAIHAALICQGLSVNCAAWHGDSFQPILVQLIQALTGHAKYTACWSEKETYYGSEGIRRARPEQGGARK